MSRRDKLLARFLSKPKDFTYEELKKLLKGFGYEEIGSGHTGGSRVTFYHEETKSTIKAHRPHPDNKIKGYLLDQVAEELKRIGVLP